MSDKTNSEISIDDLEKALLDRAEALSQEYSERAKRSHDHYIEDENKRLRLREEREEIAAKMQAEQVYRRLVQTEELKSVKRLDQLRWQLMHQVLDDVQRQLISLADNKESYLKLLKKVINEWIDYFSSEHLIIEFNSEDYQWLEPQWQSIIEQLKTEKKLDISKHSLLSIGGFMMYDKDYKVRINNTFEGMIERYSEDINQITAENLFAELTPIRSNVNDR